MRGGDKVGATDVSGMPESSGLNCGDFLWVFVRLVAESLVY